MTPQEWIEKYNEGFELSFAEFGTYMDEGLQHLAAALEEIAQLREQVAELGRPSDLRLCGSCRQTRCMAQKERQYGKTCWMYSPNTNRDVQELRDEIARLKAQLAQAERVVTRPLKDGEPCGHPGCMHHVTHPCEGCGRISGHSVPASRVLKGGEVAVRETDLRELLNQAEDVLDRYESRNPIQAGELRRSIDALRAQGKEGAP